MAVKVHKPRRYRVLKKSWDTTLHHLRKEVDFYGLRYYVDYFDGRANSVCFLVSHNIAVDKLLRVMRKEFPGIPMNVLSVGMMSAHPPYPNSSTFHSGSSMHTVIYRGPESHIAR